MVWGLNIKEDEKYYQGAVALPANEIPAEIISKISETYSGYNIGLITFSHETSSTSPHSVYGDNYSVIPYVPMYDKKQMSLHAAANEDIAKIKGKKRVNGKKQEPKTLTPEDQLRIMALNHIILVEKKGGSVQMPKLSTNMGDHNFVLDIVESAGNKIRSRVVRSEELTA